MPGCPRSSTHARRVADPFHVVRVGNRCVDQVRRRVQNETLGHRGRKADPLYRIRKLLLTGSERLDERGSRSDAARPARRRPPRRTARRLAGQGIGPRRLPRRHTRRRRDVARQGHRRLRRPTRCAEVRSLGNTLASWRTEILAHHDTGASNGPTEGLNLCVKKVKRCGHGFRSFEQLPAPRAAPRRRHHLARTTPAATHPNPLSPLRRVEPPIRRLVRLARAALRRV